MKPTELSSDRIGIFAGDDPFQLARDWLAVAETSEPNDANAMALATVDGAGLPNTRMVLLKEIRDDAFVFFTNYDSQKAAEVELAGKVAAVLHWKTQRRQLRFRGRAQRIDAAASDAYFGTRSVFSRIGAWASHQSAPLESRSVLEERADRLRAELGDNPGRPPNWGGYAVYPSEVEFWADGEARLHDRFRWTRNSINGGWSIARLNP